MRQLNYTETESVKATIRECGNFLAHREGKIFSEDGVETILNWGIENTQRCKVDMTTLAKKFYFRYKSQFDVRQFFVDDGSEPTSTPEPASVPEPTPEPVSEPTPTTQEEANASVSPFVSYVTGEVLARVHKEFDEKIANIQPREVIVKTPTQINKVDGMTHPMYESVLAYVCADEPVYLYGPAGTGKNVLGEQVAKGLGLEFYFVHAVTQEFQMTGFIDSVGNYHETEFYKAFKNGGVFFFDEMDASSSEVMTVFNGAIANHYFDFPVGRVYAHPDFKVMGAGNTVGTGATYIYNGRNQLDGATLDRFAMIPIDYDERIELSCANNDTDLVRFAHAIRKASEKAGLQITFSYRGITRIAKMMDTIGMKNAIQFGLVKGMDKGDLSTLIGNLDCYNRFADCLREIASSEQ